MSNGLLEFKEVSKEFDGNVVLKNVSFTLGKGKILGLVGENGAGKSTLMNILFGMGFIKTTGGYGGEVVVDGEVIDFNSPLDALKHGIGMVHQEFMLVPGFTVSENISLNTEPSKKNIISRLFGPKLDTIDRQAMEENAKSALNQLGVDIDPNTLVQEMPVGHKQFVEIAREIKRDKVKLIIMDEPTAVLTESEADILIRAMKDLAAQGISIIFISHRLREVIDVCDEFVVLRDGIVVEAGETKDCTVLQLAEWMVGRKSKERIISEDNRHLSDDDLILQVENFWVDMPGETVRDINLKVRRGEILGIGGLAGQGKLGFPNGIMGLYPAGGKVLFNNEELPFHDAREVQRLGLSFVSEDRRGVGLLLDEGIDWNIAFNAMQIQDRFLKKVGPFVLRDDDSMRSEAEKYISELQIRCTGPDQKARNLSGGNQQKVCLAKAFTMEPKLLFVSEPTRGIDVGAKALVLDALRRYNQEHGATIVIISSELEELRSIADRIAIVYEGSVFGILPPSAEPTSFALYMAGEDLEVEGA